MSTPTYTHDCDACLFLGTMTHKGSAHDLYFCPNGGPGPTVIARFGDEGHEYGSGLIFAEQGIEPYKTALDRAKEQGLI